MRLSARSLLSISIKLVLGLIIFAIIWPYFAPGYNRFIATTATALAHMMGKTININKVDENTIVLDVEFRFKLPQEKQPIKIKIEYEYEGYFHFNFGLLLALFAATPFLKLSQRLKHVLIALITIIVFHMLFLYVSASAVDPCVRNVIPCAERTWYRWLDRFMAVSKNLFPVFLWALLTWRSWLPMPQPTRRPTKEARP
jgi:hypothetical protein